VSTPELEQAVERMKDAGAAGARMIGGGFGGSVLGLFPPGATPPPAVLGSPAPAPGVPSAPGTPGAPGTPNATVVQPVVTPVGVGATETTPTPAVPPASKPEA
jgi:hypothetical protein